MRSIQRAKIGQRHVLPHKFKKSFIENMNVKNLFRPAICTWFLQASQRYLHYLCHAKEFFMK